MVKKAKSKKISSDEKRRRNQILRIKIVDPADSTTGEARARHGYGVALSNLAIAEANLIGQPGQDSAQPHFLALVKEIERVYGIEFEDVNEP